MIINLTPHDINVHVNGNVKVYKSEGIVRLKTEIRYMGDIDGIRITATVFGNPEGLPDFEDGTYYIVSQLVKSALPDRGDLLVPAELIRNEQGVIIGCNSLGI